ncbi:hypothetical protein [Fibrobacter succinogenes]|uniref:hypothetical protein n=1 Tax=Fibrobacter succinogenes TaxID=833 RepID=UPI00156A1DC4|nr:hypothetical protein [Fibrobacter succinogenes]
MARRRNTIAQFVSFDMQAMAARIQGMTDAKLGAWWRKAVIDCCSGCIDPKTDPFIKERYDWAMSRILDTQEHNAKMYQNRKNRLNDQETNNGTATTSCASTISTNPSQEAPTRKAGDELTESGNGSPWNPPPSCEEHLDEDRQSHQDSPSGEALVNQGSASGSTVRGLAKVSQPGADSPADLFPEDTAKKPYGTCKHVMLTDAEGHHLREVYGTDLALAIEILDAYLENNPKALKKYKNHAAVLRKGNWVWQKVQEYRINEKRLENATKNNKSFKQQDLDARTEFFTHSIFDNGDVQ